MRTIASCLLLAAGLLLGGCASAPARRAADDCREAEQRAREVAFLLPVKHDLPALTCALRDQVSQCAEMAGVQPGLLAVDDCWTYVGDGSRWFFRSGAWSMEIDNLGDGPIHFRGTASERSLDVYVDATVHHGQYTFSGWRVDEWIFICFPIELDDGEARPVDCTFVIPVPSS